MQKHWFFGLLAVLFFIGAASFYFWNHPFFTIQPSKTAVPEKTIRIGLSLDTLRTLRWQKDRTLMEEEAKKAGATLDTLIADENDATQINQIENFISQKVDVIIIVAHNSKVLGPVIVEAHDAGIKVISYDRLILDSDVDAYVSFDNEKVGRYGAQYVMQAVPKEKTSINVAYMDGPETDNNVVMIREGVMSILTPLIENKTVHIVFDKSNPDWKADEAYKNLKTFLDNGGKVDAIIGANDGMAFGSIQALKEHGLAGKVPVSGQDADLAAVRSLVDGTQTVTMYKPLHLLAKQAIKTAVDLVNTGTFETNATVNNNQKEVVSFLIDPVPVTKDNIKETVVKDGYYSMKDIYQ